MPNQSRHLLPTPAEGTGFCISWTRWLLFRGNCPWKALCLLSCCCVMMMMMMIIFIAFSSSFSCSLLSCGGFFSSPFPSPDFPTEVRWLYNLQWLLTELPVSPSSHEGILQLHEITIFVTICVLVFWGQAEWQGLGAGWLSLLYGSWGPFPQPQAWGLAESWHLFCFLLDLFRPGHDPMAGGSQCAMSSCL